MTDKSILYQSMLYSSMFVLILILWVNLTGHYGLCKLFYILVNGSFLEG